MAWKLYRQDRYDWPEEFRPPVKDARDPLVVALGAAKTSFETMVRGLADFSKARDLAAVVALEAAAVEAADHGYSDLGHKLATVAKLTDKARAAARTAAPKDKALIERLKKIQTCVADCRKDLVNPKIKLRIVELARDRMNEMVKGDVRTFVDTVTLTDKHIKSMRRLNRLNVEAGPDAVRQVNTDFHRLLADCNDRLRRAARRLKRHLDGGWRVPGLDGGNLDAALGRMPDPAEVDATTPEALRSALNVKHDAARAGWNALNDIADRLA